MPFEHDYIFLVFPLYWESIGALSIKRSMSFIVDTRISDVLPLVKQVSCSKSLRLICRPSRQAGGYDVIKSVPVHNGRSLSLNRRLDSYIRVRTRKIVISKLYNVKASATSGAV